MYLPFEKTIFLKLKSFLVKYICVPVTDDSAIIVAKAAPNDKNLGMSKKFRQQLTTHPVTTEIVYSFCLPVGSRYCIPIILLIAIIQRIGEIIIIFGMTLSYPDPKNHGS